MSGCNMLFASIGAAGTFTLPDGFIFASISPSSGATFTITNSLPNDLPGISTRVSNTISGVYSFPPAPGQNGWGAHVITASGGTVTITYTTGR